MYRFFRVLFSIVVAVSLTLGQTMVDLRTQSKSVDFSAANTTKPFKSGLVLPASCTVGEMFYKTDSIPGLNLYGCTATSSWTLQGGIVLPGLAGNAGRVLSTDGVNLNWGTLSLGGDVNGLLAATTVTRLQSRPVSPVAPTSGQPLVWNASTNTWEPRTLTLLGDVTGLLGATTVTQLQSRPVASTAPASGQSLVWNGASNWWEPQTVQGPTGTTLPGQSGNTGRLLSTDGTNLSWGAFAGDVAGLLGSTTVTQLQNRALSATAPTSGQSIVWNGATNRWEPQTVQGSSGTTLPGQSGNTGRLLSTDGTNLSWGAFGGDVTGLLGSTTVTQLQNRAMSATAPTSGQSLVWNGASNWWEPQTVQGSTGTTLPGQSGNTGRLLSTDGTNLSRGAFGGDVTGLLGSTTVTQLQNRAMSSTAPASGQSIVWNGATNRWEPQTAQGSSGTTLPGQSGNTGRLLSTDGTNLSWGAFGGDVTGLLGSTTVTQLQNRAMSATAPASGQSIVWNGATNRWEPQTVQGSSGTTLPGQSGNNGRLLSTDGTNLSWGAFGGDVTGLLGSTTVTQLQKPGDVRDDTYLWSVSGLERSD